MSSCLAMCDAQKISSCQHVKSPEPVEEGEGERESRASGGGGGGEGVRSGPGWTLELEFADL